MSDYIWSWGYDGSVLDVFEVYYSFWTGRTKLKRIKHFYTADFTDVVATAEKFIARLEEADTVSEDPKNSQRKDV